MDTSIQTQSLKSSRGFPAFLWGNTGRLKRREAISGMLMASPWMIGFIIFTAGPMIFSLLMSFTRWDIISPPRFIGLENYATIFTQDPLVGQSLKVTVVYTLLSVPLHVGLGLLLAMLLNNKVIGSSVFRAIFYLPSVLPIVATAVLFSWVFNPEFGLLNYALSLIGIDGPGWLTSETWALPAIVIMNIQYIGFTMVLFLAALQRVPQELIEAAQLDGARRLDLFVHVTLPIISPVILLTIILNINNSFQTFTQAYVMTNGGPSNATLFYMLHLYNNAFRYYKMGYASALSWVLFLIIVGFTLLNFWLSRRWVYNEGS